MLKRFVLVPLLLLAGHQPLFAQKEGDIRVKEAFIHQQSGYMVLRLEVYSQHPYFSSAPLAWKDFWHRDAGLYWGNPKKGTLYKLKAGMEERSVEGDEVNFFIASPTESNANHKTPIRVSYKRWGDQIYESKLTVDCGGVDVCFKMPPGNGAELNAALNDGSLKLEGLPDVRVVVDVFKLPGEESYIVIDAKKFGDGLRSIEVKMGEPGQMQSASVSKVEYVRDGGTTRIELSAGQTIESPSPGRVNRGEKPSITSTDGQTTVLENVQWSNGLLEHLGVDSTRYRVTPLKTPCDLVFIKDPSY